MSEQELAIRTPEEREAALSERLARIRAMEEEILLREKAIKQKENAKKSIILRLPPSLHNQVAAWAEEDFRSVNGQIEYLLSRAVQEKYGKG